MFCSIASRGLRRDEKRSEKTRKTLCAPLHFAQISEQKYYKKITLILFNLPNRSFILCLNSQCFMVEQVCERIKKKP